MVRKICETCWF